MKIKFLVPILISITIGCFFGKVVFNQYDKNLKPTMSEGELVYFLQQGAYSSEENMKKNTTGLEKYIYAKEGNMYKVYVGITKTKENAEKLKEYYNKNGNDIYIKEMTLKNNEFLDDLTQYDKLLEEAKDETAAISVAGQIISKYKEVSK